VGSGVPPPSGLITSFETFDQDMMFSIFLEDVEFMSFPGGKSCTNAP
jgi:hypothetical protein